MRSNQGTLIHQKPIVRRRRPGRRRRRAGRRLGRPTPVRTGARQEPAGRLHVLEGYNFEDAMILSAAGIVKDDELDASIHIEEYGDRRATTTKLGDEEIDPRHSEPLGGVAAQPRRPRHRAHRRRGRVGDLLVGKVTAEGRDRSDRRGEADPRDLQGKAREVRDTRSRCPTARAASSSTSRRSAVTRATTCRRRRRALVACSWPRSARSPRKATSCRTPCNKA